MSDPQVVKFCNEQVRPFCDRIAQVTKEAQLLVSAFSAKGLESLMVANEQIEDGSATDGRTPMTKDDVVALVAATSAIIATLEDQSLEALILKIAVNF